MGSTRLPPLHCATRWRKAGAQGGADMEVSRGAARSPDPKPGRSPLGRSRRTRQAGTGSRSTGLTPPVDGFPDGEATSPRVARPALRPRLPVPTQPVFSGKLGAAAVIPTTSGRRDVHPGGASGTRPAGSPEAPHLVPQTAWPAMPRPELQGAGTHGRLGAITGQLVMSHVPPQRTPAPPRAAVCRAVT